MRISDWSSDVCSSDLSVVAEQLAPAVGHRAGVDDRQVVLVAVGHVEVEQPRLQGVDVVVAAEADVAVEVQPGVERARSAEHTSELQSLMRISYAVCCVQEYTSRRYHAHIKPHN